MANVWRDTVVQTCIVHRMRNSLRYAARQDWGCDLPGLKPVYQATTVEQAEERSLEFAEAWGKTYPAIIRLGENAWAEFVPFLHCDREIRRVLCTTNAIESVNARHCKAVKARGHFPDGQVGLPCVYLAIMAFDPTGRARARWTPHWKQALNASAITCDDRLSAVRR